MSSNKKSDNSPRPAGKPLRGPSSKTASAKKAPAKTVKGAVAARRPAASSSGVARPRIRASHADGPAVELSDKEKEKRRTRAKATVRSLGGARTTGTKRNLPPPSKREPAAPRSVQEKRRSLPPGSDSLGQGAEPSAAAREMALTIAGAGLDKKAIGIEVINVAGRVDYADFLVIMTGTSDRHVHAIAMGIEEALKKKRIAPLSIEGLSSAVWVLMDFDDIVVHVFQEETRRVYDIEGLWMDASRLPVEAIHNA